MAPTGSRTDSARGLPVGPSSPPAFLVSSSDRHQATSHRGSYWPCPEASEVQHVFTDRSAICLSPFAKRLFISFAHFPIRLFEGSVCFVLWSCVSFLLFGWTLTSYQIDGLQIFSPISGCLCTLLIFPSLCKRFGYRCDPARYPNLCCLCFGVLSKFFFSQTDVKKLFSMFSSDMFVASGLVFKP